MSRVKTGSRGRWITTLAGVAVAAALLVGGLFCKGGKAKAPSGPAGSAVSATATGASYEAAFIDERVPGEAKDEGDWLVRHLEADCSTFNEVLSSTNYEAFVLMYVNRHVVNYDQKGRFAPALAESWDMSPDHLTYTFHLRKDATWEDGVPVTADDFEFTIQKIVDPKVPAGNKKGPFADYDASRVVDAHTFEIKFKRPFAGQLCAFDLGLVPKHVYAKGDFLRHPANRKPVGNGPFKFVRWETGKEIELVRREDYWGEKPAYKKVLFKIVPDQSVALNAFKTRQIDDMRLSSIQWKDVKDEPAFTKIGRVVVYYDTIMPNFISWNNKSAFFSDKRVRQAMTQLVDREKILKSLYFGTGAIASGPFPYGSWARNPALAPWPYSPPEAQKKLELAGWKDTNGNGIRDKDGKEFKFDIIVPSGVAITEQVSTLLQRELERVGVKMEIRQLEYATMTQKIMSGDYDAAAQSLTYDIDPDPSGLLHSSAFVPNGMNFFFYSNPEADRLIDQARVEFDQEKRKALYVRLQEILHEDQPFSPLLYPTMKWAIAKRFRGINVSPIGLFLQFPGSLDWWVPKAEQLHN